MIRFPRASRAAAIALFVGIAVWGITLYRRPSPPVSSRPPRPASFSVDVPWRRSNWDNAHVTRAARHRAFHDPGITGNHFIPPSDCKDCDGLGGHKSRTPDDPEDGDDMTTCDSCAGSGVVSPH